MVSQTAMPTDEIGRVKGDGDGYDIGINPAKNMMLTSSFTGWNNCMMDLGKLVKDGEAMKRLWPGTSSDVKAMKPAKIPLPVDISITADGKGLWVNTFMDGMTPVPPQHQVGGVLAPGGLELEHDLPGGVGLHAFVGQSGARDVAAPLLQRLAVVGAAAHGCMQAKAINFGAQRPLEVCVPRHCALHR
jgi:hypothetical protein